MPAPGCTPQATSMPMMSARVVTTSKYKSAFQPTLPIFFRSPMLAMPCTIVQKMIGAMSIFTAFTNAVPSGSIFAAMSGESSPSATPSTTPIKTCT